MTPARPTGAQDDRDARPTLAVWKFASCDGCQLSLLDCEDELLTLAGAVRIAHFTEMSRATVDGPYDVSLVEGSITTARGRRADPGDQGELASAHHHRRLRVRRRDSGPAQLRRRGRLCRCRLRPPRIHLLAVHLDSDLGARGCRSRGSRMPD